VVDARIVRTNRVVERAVVELAAETPASQITVSALCAKAGVTRRTFYNRFDSPQEALVQALRRDLAELAIADAERRTRAGEPSADLLRLANADIFDHVSRYQDIYRQALTAAADTGVFDVLVEHFVGYSLAFVRRVRALDLTEEGIELVAQFVAHGFAGAIRTWLRSPAITREVLEDAVAAAAPAWWASPG
jgi:AcrR family transcriptional regulator